MPPHSGTSRLYNSDSGSSNIHVLGLRPRSCIFDNPSSSLYNLYEEHEKVKRGNSDYDAFPLHELQVAFGNIFTLHTLKLAYSWPLIVPVCERFVSFADAR